MVIIIRSQFKYFQLINKIRVCKGEIIVEGKKVKALVRWDSKKLGKDGNTEINGRYLGIMYYGSQNEEGTATDTCLLVVEDETGIVVEVACGDVTFLE